MSSQDKNLPYEILTLSHSGFKYCSVRCTKLPLMGFILFAETNQIFLKISIILTLSTFMYEALYQKTRTQLIIVKNNCSNNLHIFQTK